MTCIDFTNIVIRRMVAAGFEVIPVAVGDRMMRLRVCTNCRAFFGR
jgi:hypothetical protein